MRYSIITISILCLSTALFGQKTKKKGLQLLLADTTFITEELNNFLDGSKTVAVEIGKKATIFLSLNQILPEVEAYLNSDSFKSNYKKIIDYFDSASSKSDTIILTNYRDLRYLEFLISHLLIKGEAKVFYKRQGVFIDTIFHRLERYGGNADRFFYMPDKRPFFAVQEYSGILDNEDNSLGKGHFDAYLKEGEKLASIRNE